MVERFAAVRDLRRHAISLLEESRHLSGLPIIAIQWQLFSLGVLNKEWTVPCNAQAEKYKDLSLHIRNNSEKILTK